MKKLILTWAILRLVWESKGYSMKEMPDLLRGQWPDRKGFAFASIQRKAQDGKKAPSDVSRFVMDAEKLPLRAGHEKPAEVVRLGLAALLGEPTPNRQPPELALALLANFPTSELALQLADALAKRAGLSSETGSLLDGLGRAIADRLPHVLKLREAKLARRLAQHLDHLSAKRIALAGAAGGVGGSAVTCAVLGLALAGLMALLLTGRLQVVAHPQTNAVNITQQPVIIVMNASQGSTPFVFDARALLGAVAAMGKKAVEHWVPKEPLPYQKPAKDCEPRLGERAINGGCWVPVGHMAPPCELLFRDGNECYRPVAADPQKPVGVTPEAPGEEAR